MRDKFDKCYNELCHRKPSDDRWTVTELRFANDYLKYLQLLDFTAWLLVIWMLTFIAGIFGFLAWLFYSSAIGMAFVIASGLALCPITLHGAHSFFKLLPLSKKLTVQMRKVKDGWEYDLYSR